jgi:hypothetical protein
MFGQRQWRICELESEQPGGSQVGEIEGKCRGGRGEFIEAYGEGFNYRNRRESRPREISARTRSPRDFWLEVEDEPADM